MRGEQKLCYFLESIKLILKQYLKVCGEMMIQINVKHCMYILELNLISLWNEYFKLYMYFSHRIIFLSDINNLSYFIVMNFKTKWLVFSSWNMLNMLSPYMYTFFTIFHKFNKIYVVWVCTETASIIEFTIMHLLAFMAYMIFFSFLLAVCYFLG